jgi:hypothetical protein
MTYAAEFLGYAIAPQQAQFYILILQLIGVSIALVLGAYLIFWVADLRKQIRSLFPPTEIEPKGFSAFISGQHRVGVDWEYSLKNVGMKFEAVEKDAQKVSEIPKKDPANELLEEKMEFEKRDAGAKSPRPGS